MKVLKIVVILYCVFVFHESFSQAGYTIPPGLYSDINQAYQRNVEAARHSTFKDEWAINSRIELLVSGRSVKGKLPTGVYSLIAPMDPITEFICLIKKDSICVLDSREISNDFPIIAKFLRENGVKKSDDGWIQFFEKIVSVYEQNSPPSVWWKARY